MQLQASQQFLPLKMAMSIVYASCLALTLRDAYGVAALAAWCGLVIAASIACHNALRSEELGGARGRARVTSIWAATAVLAIPNLLWMISAIFLTTLTNAYQAPTVFLVRQAMMASTVMRFTRPAKRRVGTRGASR